MKIFGCSTSLNTCRINLSNRHIPSFIIASHGYSLLEFSSAVAFGPSKEPIPNWIKPVILYLHRNQCYISDTIAQPAFSCWKLTLETPKQCSKSFQSKPWRHVVIDTVSVSLLLTLYKFYTLFWCFHSIFWI